VGVEAGCSKDRPIPAVQRDEIVAAAAGRLFHAVHVDVREVARLLARAAHEQAHRPGCTQPLAPGAQRSRGREPQTHIAQRGPRRIGWQGEGQRHRRFRQRLDARHPTVHHNRHALVRRQRPAIQVQNCVCARQRQEQAHFGALRIHLGGLSGLTGHDRRRAPPLGQYHPALCSRGCKDLRDGRLAGQRIERQRAVLRDRLQAQQVARSLFRLRRQLVAVDHHIADVQERGPGARPRPVGLRHGRGSQRVAQRSMLGQVRRVSERDEPSERRVLAKILELEFRIARGVAAEQPLAVLRLVPELLHDEDVLLARHPRAVAPAERQLQQREVARRLRNALVQRRHAQIEHWQGRGQMLEQQERQQKKRQNPPGRGRQPGLECPPQSRRAERDQGREAGEQHDAIAAGITIALEEGQLLHDTERQRQASVVPRDAQARAEGQQKEQDGRCHPEPDRAPPPAVPHADDGQRQRRVTHVDVLPLVHRELRARLPCRNATRPAAYDVTQ